MFIVWCVAGSGSGRRTPTVAPALKIISVALQSRDVRERALEVLTCWIFPYLQPVMSAIKHIKQEGQGKEKKRAEIKESGNGRKKGKKNSGQNTVHEQAFN
jgi:hypothetical protein